MHRAICPIFCLQLLGLSAVLKAQTYSVSLSVKEESWVVNSTFDKAGLTKQCASAGVNFGAATDGHVVIEYKETKGSGYGIAVPVGDSAGYGTNISYRMTLRSVRDSSQVIVLAVTTSTPPSVKAFTDLHQAARIALEESPEYSNSCSAIAAVFGSSREAAKLLPWALTNSTPRNLLTQIRFVPTSPTQRAYLAIVNRDFAQLRQIGHGSEPLVRFIEPQLIRPLRAYHIPTDQDKRHLAEAVDVLADVGDKIDSEIFAHALGTARAWKEEAAHLRIKLSNGAKQAQNQLALAGLKGLRRFGGVSDFGERELKRWVNDPVPVGPAARELVDSIRAETVRK